MSFIMYTDRDGKRRLVDAFMADVIKCPCPACGKANTPFNFWYQDFGGCVGRRYIFCCSYCLLHYTDWGPEADKSPTFGIERPCSQNGDHAKEKESALELMRELWQMVHSEID